MTDRDHVATPELDTSDFDVTPGRPIRLEPTAPGFWMTALGVVVAALAPLFGFLFGVMSGRSDTGMFSPLYWGLFTGVIIGGVGVLAAVAGGVRLWRHHQGARAANAGPTASELRP